MGVLSISFTDKFFKNERQNHKHLVTCVQQLSEYFSGKRTVFSVPICLHGTTFQKKVWECCNSILYGTTKTYGDIAYEIGNRKLSLAVGQAIAYNPILIIVPCHRIIHASRKKSGYSAGIERKKWLLEFEVAQNM